MVLFLKFCFCPLLPGNHPGLFTSASPGRRSPARETLPERSAALFRAAGPAFIDAEPRLYRGRHESFPPAVAAQSSHSHDAKVWYNQYRITPAPGAASWSRNRAAFPVHGRVPRPVIRTGAGVQLSCGIVIILERIILDLNIEDSMSSINRSQAVSPPPNCRRSVTGKCTGSGTRTGTRSPRPGGSTSGARRTRAGPRHHHPLIRQGTDTLPPGPRGGVVFRENGDPGPGDWGREYSTDDNPVSVSRKN